MPQLAAQSVSPYQVGWARDAPLTVAALSLAVSGHLYQTRFLPLSQTELLQLDRRSINALDRGATRNWRPRAGQWSDAGLITGAVAPLMMLSLPPMRQDWFRYLLLWGQAFSLTEGLTNWAKTLILRPRPLAYYYAADYPHVPVGLAEAALTTDTRFSYFSGHTSMTAVSSFFVARTFADYCPDSRAKPWVWASAALLPALVGIWRVRAGKHYPTDVLTGYLVGASVGLLIPALHRRK